MNARFTDRTVQSAAHWYARLQALDSTPSDRAEFERWCAEDPAHAAAYALARDLVARVSRATDANPRLRAMADQAFAASSVNSASRRTRRNIAVAATLAASVVAVFGAATMLRPVPEPDIVAAMSHIATRSEMRTLTLDDGTVVHVDLGSDLDVRFTARRREVALQHGRAVFDVTHDTSRPFVVVAGNERVTAVGTRFQVAHGSANTVVTLAEGIVTVSGAAGGEQRTARLVPGDELRIAAGDEQWAMRTVDPRVVTSWSIGRLMFRETRLVDALQEVNRYAATKIRLADSSLADLPVSGNFVAGDSRAVVTAFAAMLPLRIADDGDALLLYRSQHH